MTLGTLIDLRKRLGRRSRLKITASYACAVKKAAGYGGARYFDIDGVVAWFAANPGFRVTQVYPRRQSPGRNSQGRRAPAVRKLSEHPLTNGQ